MKIGVLIAEKPDLARHVQNAINLYGYKDQLIITSFHGHIMELYSPSDYDEKYEKWNISDIPIIPLNFKYKVKDEVCFGKIENIILQACFKTNEIYLINCCDPDREGQLIFHSFYDYLTKRNPNINMPVYRMWHSDLTEKELIRAINNMEDDNITPRLSALTNASKLRAEMDWLIGMNATRILTIKRNVITRTGRVMTPTLEILANREAEIANFKPTTSYVPQLILHTNPQLIIENEQEFKTKDECIHFLNTLDLSKGALVVKYEEKTNVSKAPQFMTTADVQSLANKRFGFTLNETLEILQKLYEKKFISYPRVDSNYITSAVASNISNIIVAIENSGMFSNELQYINKNKIADLIKDKRYVDDKKVTSHYALILTGEALVNINEQQLKILSLIVQSILAPLAFDAVNVKSKAEFSVDGNTFTIEGNFTKELGWKNIIPTPSKEEPIPRLNEGMLLPIRGATIKEKTTKAPSRYNDGSIIKAMINAGKFVENKELANVIKANGDSGGIGRPSTRAAIVEKLLEPIKINQNGNTIKLVERIKGSFYVTEQGMDLAKYVASTSLASPELTAVWEEKLLKIEHLELDVMTFQKEMTNYIIDMCNKLKMLEDTNVKAGGDMTYVRKAVCPICGDRIKETKNYYICDSYKKTCTFILKKDFFEAKITNTDIIALTNNKLTRTKKFVSQLGKPFEARLGLDKETKKIEFDFVLEEKAEKKRLNKLETKEIGNNINDDVKCFENKTFCCPICSNSLIYKTGKYGNYYECSTKDFKIKEVIAGHIVTENELKTLLDGESIEVNGLVSKKGNKFKAKLKLIEGKINFEFLN